MKQILALVIAFSCNSLYGQGLPTAPQVRQMIAGEIKQFGIKPAALAKTENVFVWNGVDSIPVRIYYPDNKPNHRVIYNIHGGALVGGDLDTHENISSQLAVRTQSVVVALDYRKAPEHPFPASIDDCETVLQWIKKNGAKMNADATNLVITGDSGGGLFATVLATKLKSGLGAKAICLINPAVDLRTPSQGLYTLVTKWYLGTHSATDSLASPILARDFSAFPPTLVITSGKDELKPHGEAIYEKIRSYTTARLFNIPEEDHLGGLWAAAHPRASAALDEVVKFINSY